MMDVHRVDYVGLGGRGYSIYTFYLETTLGNTQ